MLNTITICGRICNELELKYTQSGTEVLTFTVACERDFKDGNGEKQSDFIDVVAFKNTATFVNQYFGKGRAIIVNGRLQTRTWQDKDGKNRKAFEVVANNVYFADSKTAAVEVSPNFENIGNDEDLPF
jgi:single-strand DNA-binding protein